MVDPGFLDFLPALAWVSNGLFLPLGTPPLSQVADGSPPDLKTELPFSRPSRFFFFHSRAGCRIFIPTHWQCPPPFLFYKRVVWEELSKQTVPGPFRANPSLSGRLPHSGAKSDSLNEGLPDRFPESLIKSPLFSPCPAPFPLLSPGKGGPWRKG